MKNPRVILETILLALSMGFVYYCVKSQDSRLPLAALCVAASLAMYLKDQRKGR